MGKSGGGVTFFQSLESYFTLHWRKVGTAKSVKLWDLLTDPPPQMASDISDCSSWNLRFFFNFWSVGQTVLSLTVSVPSLPPPSPERERYVIDSTDYPYLDTNFALQSGGSFWSVSERNMCILMHPQCSSPLKRAPQAKNIWHPSLGGGGFILCQK